jgi:hypothetical protein
MVRSADPLPHPRTTVRKRTKDTPGGTQATEGQPGYRPAASYPVPGYSVPNASISARSVSVSSRGASPLATFVLCT